MGSSLLLGEILVKRGQVRRYQLEFALKLQKIYGKLRIEHRLGDLLLSHRGLSGESLTEALRYQAAQIEASQSKQKVCPLDQIEDEETETKVIS